MSRLQITCITKRGGHNNAHERISAIGGIYSFGGSWKKSEKEAIVAIENKTDSFFVHVDGREVKVVVATHSGRKYLKTERDDYSPDNLLSLREC